MTALFIPQNGCTLTFEEDTPLMINWWKRNLRMLAKFKLTGMKEVQRSSYACWDSEQQKYVSKEYVRRETVPNPLFRDYDGQYAPAEITIPAGTAFTLSRYNYTHYCGIRSVDLKCLESPKPGIKGLCLQLPLEDLNGINVLISDMPEATD